MGFHYAKERQKFEITWKILREEYRRAGMDEDAINSMYDFDLEEFHSRRRYEMRSRPLSDLYHDEGTGNPKPFRLGKDEAISTYFDESDFPGRYAWIETIDNPILSERLKQLQINDLELLTYVVLEGHSQKELAQKWNCSQRAVSKRFQKIKKILK